MWTSQGIQIERHPSGCHASIAKAYPLFEARPRAFELPGSAAHLDAGAGLCQSVFRFSCPLLCRRKERTHHSGALLGIRSHSQMRKHKGRKESHNRIGCEMQGQEADKEDAVSVTSLDEHLMNWEEQEKAEDAESSE